MLGTSIQQSFSSVSPTSNRIKTHETPTPTDSFSSSLTSGTGTLRPYLSATCSNFLNAQNSSISSDVKSTSPTLNSDEIESYKSRYVSIYLIKYH